MEETTIGQRIAARRKQLGISQEALGEKTGVSRQAISKWESDSAIPEIDKLIVLSRLFGVSVGWLLGVEELPAQPDTQDQQILLAEEIAKRCQPQPNPHKKWYLLCLGCILLGLILLFSFQYQQISSLRSQTETLRRNLSALESDLVYFRSQQNSPAVTSAPQSAATPTLLADYDFQLEFIPNAPSMKVTFTSTPATWAAEDTGYLYIGADGQETLKLECDYDGAFLTASTELEIRDGYDLAFAVSHGPYQELQVLTNRYVANLKSATTMTLSPMIGRFAYEDRVLTLKNFGISFSMPFLADYDVLHWKKIEFILYRDREEVSRWPLLDASLETDLDVIKTTSGSTMHTSIPFYDIDPPEVSDIQLWVSAELSNGITEKQLICSWTPDAKGNLTIQDHSTTILQN